MLMATTPRHRFFLAVASAHNRTQQHPTCAPTTGAAWTSSSTAQRLSAGLFAATPHTGFAAVAHRLAPALRSCARRSCPARRRAPQARRLPLLNTGGPRQLVGLGNEVGGRWTADAQQLLRDLVRPCPTNFAGHVKRCIVGMGQTLVGHTSSVGTKGRHKHCPRIGIARTAPREPAVGLVAGPRARPC